MKKLLLLAAIFGLYSNIYSCQTNNKETSQKMALSDFLEMTKNMPTNELHKYSNKVSSDEFRFALALRNNQNFTTPSKKELRQFKKIINKITIYKS